MSLGCSFTHHALYIDNKRELDYTGEKNRFVHIPRFGTIHGYSHQNTSRLSGFQDRCEIDGQGANFIWNHPMLEQLDFKMST